VRVEIRHVGIGHHADEHGSYAIRLCFADGSKLHISGDHDGGPTVFNGDGTEARPDADIE
jgi:hypothetical protein